MIPRNIEPKIMQYLENKGEFNNILIVEGARQVGKTTVIRNVLRKIEYPYKEFNLEEDKVLAEKIDLCKSFDEFTELAQVEMKFKVGTKEILFIDEAQESRKLGGFIRFMKEKWRNTQVILSGSIMGRIFRDDIRYPVGRIFSLHLQPFSFSEFLYASGEQNLLEKLQSFSEDLTLSPNTHSLLLRYIENYLEVGGLPEVVTSYFDKKDWKSIRKNILLGYYNDFKRVYGEEKQSYFIASLVAASNLLGAPFKNSYVAKLLDGGKNKNIIESLSQLEAWKMIYKISQRGDSATSNYHPKRYVFDLGIAKELRESGMPGTSLFINNSFQRTSLGGLIENFVCFNLINFGNELSGWKKKVAGSEVDFVVKFKDSIVPIECKSAVAIKNTHLGGGIDFMNIYGLKLGIVFSLAQFEIRKIADNKKIIIIPIYLVEQWEKLINRGM